MKNGCDICMPQHKGYTVTFKNQQDIKPLMPYFASFDSSLWTQIDETSFWAEETVVFDMLDYLEAHFDASNIFAVSTMKTDDEVDWNTLQPISELHKQKQAG
ncbi:hypothetical protein [Salibacterium halotolerans]|uniref:Uncharacterized protein n=1 Tax=Salibacterium halotolerans TaxID=1884432 RepID=A0A1I5PD96_9BACI|nr:hypothetical protein [Salibacterium halotolerans]SFP31800.1 hypothetical protein SAMN05518683_10470 [Salibacterium halotolerans]